MKRMKILTMLLVGGCMCFSLVGCGSKAEPKTSDLTVQGIFEKSDESYENIKDLKSVDVSASFGISGSVTEGTTSMEVGISGDIGLQGEKDGGIHTNGTLDVNVLGITEKVTLDEYIKYDGDKQINYSYDYENDSWTFEELDRDEEEDGSADKLIEELSKLDCSALYNSLTLAKGTVDYNNTKAYHVSGDISGDDIKPLMKDISSLSKDVLTEDVDLSAVEDIDLSGLVISCNFYFSTEDYQIIGMKYDFSKSNFDEIIKKAMELSGSEEEKEMSAKFDNLFFEIKFNGIDNYSFSIPDDVVNNAKEAEDIFDMEHELETN